MPLPRYNPSEARLQIGAGIAENAQAQTWQNLSNKLEQWGNVAYKYGAEKRTAEGREQALSDVAETGSYTPKDEFTVYGKAYNQAASATYAAKADIDISKKSDELSLQFQNDPSSYNEEMEKYLQEYTKESPSIELNTVVNLSGTKVKDNTLGKLLIAQDKRRRDYQVTTFKQSWDLNLGQIVDLEASGKNNDALALKVKNLEHLNTLVNDGLITPAAAKDLVNESEYKITLNTALENMKMLLDDDTLDNATKYLEAVNKENRADLTIEQNDKMQAELNRMYSGEVKRRKAENKNKEEFSNQIIGDAIDILKEGKTPDNMTQIDAALGSASKAKKWEFEKQKKAAKIYNKNFINIPLSDMEDALNAYEAKKTASAIDVEVMKILRKNLSEKQTAVKNDVVGQAIRDGIIKPSAGMSQQDGLESLLVGLSQMKENTNLIKEHYGVDKVDLLSKQDAQSWADYLSSPAVDVNEKMGFIASINSQYPEISKDIFNQIGGKNAGTFMLAADLAINGNEKAGKIMMLGKGAEVELEDGFKIDLKSKIGNAFGGYDSEVFNRYYKGLIDYAKGQSLNNEVLNVDDIIEGSIGQIQKYNNKNTIIPFGVEKREFEAWLDKIEIPGRPKVQEGLRDMTDTFFDGNYQLHYAGQGQYYVVDDNNGNPFYVPDTEDPTKPMILKWGK